MLRNQMFDSSIAAYRLLLSTEGEGGLPIVARTDIEKCLQVRMPVNLVSFCLVNLI
jgi:hypothetical protein